MTQFQADALALPRRWPDQPVPACQILCSRFGRWTLRMCLTVDVPEEVGAELIERLEAITGVTAGPCWHLSAQLSRADGRFPFYAAFCSLPEPSRRQIHAALAAALEGAGEGPSHVQFAGDALHIWRALSSDEKAVLASRN